MHLYVVQTPAAAHQVFYPLIFLFFFFTFGTVDFGTAHLWFILTIGYAINRYIYI